MEIRGQRNPPAPKPFLVPKPAPLPGPVPIAEVNPEPASQQAPRSLVFQEKPKPPNEPAEPVEIPVSPACGAGNNARQEGIPAVASAAGGSGQSQPGEKFFTPTLS